MGVYGFSRGKCCCANRERPIGQDVYKRQGSVYALALKVYIFDVPAVNLDYAATKRLADIMEKLKSAGYTIFVVEHRFYYLREMCIRDRI